MTWDWPDHPGKKKPASKGGQEFVCFNRRNYPKKSTNGLLVSHVLRIQRVPVLRHHHAEHCSNLRDQKDFVFVQKFKNIALEPSSF